MLMFLIFGTGFLLGVVLGLFSSSFLGAIEVPEEVDAFLGATVGAMIGLVAIVSGALVMQRSTGGGMRGSGGKKIAEL